MPATSSVTRCDLHLHSNRSVGSDEWYTEHFGCAESYADPVRQYELCKARGMDLVTLTDHDTIDGGLILIDRPDFFLSEEVSARFPDEDCIIHVLTWNITPAQHERIQAARDDVYRLVELLQSEKICHGLAHPLLSMNWKLDASVVEKLILLFPTWELMNGLVDSRMQGDLEAILSGIDAGVVARLEREHDLKARGATPHRKALTGGSDDHVHRRAAAVFTEIDGRAASASDFLVAVEAGQTRVAGEQANLASMTLAASHTAYSFLSSRRDEKPEYVDPFVDLVDLLAGRLDVARYTGGPGNGSRVDFVASLREAAAGAALTPAAGLDVLAAEGQPTLERDERVAGALARVIDRLLERSLSEMWEAVIDFDLYRLFGAGRDLFAALTTAGPFIGAADHFAKQDQQATHIRDTWRAFPLPERQERLAIFSDSIDHVDGVASSCKRFASAARKAGRTVLVPTCGDQLPLVPGDAGASFVKLERAATFSNPLYPAYTVHLPSLVGTLDWMWRERITCVELATPGPMGLIGLVAAKLLRLPVTASYHTEVPGLIECATNNPFLVQTARKYLCVFYRQVDRVFSFSQASRAKVISLGVEPTKVQLLPVSLDPDEFSPEHRAPEVFEALELDVDGRFVVLSVGRVSKEKNLDVVIDAVAALQDRATPPLLLIVGDGPELGALEARAAGCSFVRFLGPQQGETLKRIYASSDVFAFASQIDTLGLAAMEAMCSGAPVLVPRGTGISELVRHGKNGYCYEPCVEGLTRAIAEVFDDPELARRLAVAGRRDMIARWKTAGFEATWGAITARN